VGPRDRVNVLDNFLTPAGKRTPDRQARRPANIPNTLSKLLPGSVLTLETGCQV